jgi:hypothetical protein
MISTSNFYVSKTSVSTSFSSIININFYGELLGAGSTDENPVLPVHRMPSRWGNNQVWHRDGTSSLTPRGPPHRSDHPRPAAADSPCAPWNQAAVTNGFWHLVCRVVATNGYHHRVRCATSNGCRHQVRHIVANGCNERLLGPPLSTPCRGIWLHPTAPHPTSTSKTVASGRVEQHLARSVVR